MKKGITLLLTLLAVLSFSSCNSTETDDSSVTDNSAQPSKVTSQNESSISKTEESSLPDESSKPDESSSKSSKPFEIPETELTFDSSYAFLGNSIIGDLEAYDVADDAEIYSYVGLNVSSVFDQKLDGHKKPILDEMLEKEYSTIFIMLGTNELGWTYPDMFIDNYGELIDTIHETLPECDINLISVTPITKNKEEEKQDGLNMKRINEYNEKIKKLAKDKEIDFLDVNKYLVDESGYLPEDDSPDGCHFEPNVSLKFVNAIKYLISK